MEGIPPHWRAYARVQVELSNYDQCSSEAWGLEACLNRMLEHELCEQPVADIEANRARNAGSRRERNRRRLQRQNFIAGFSNPVPMIEARSTLAALKRAMSVDDWTLLLALSEGKNYTDLVSEVGGTAGALRVRVKRLRDTVRAAV